MASNTSSPIYCAVCKEKMNRQEKQPVCLPSCGHSFCRECLICINDTTGRINCPTCRIYHQGQPPQDLPVNWLLLEMLDKEDGEITSNQDSAEVPIRNTRETPLSTNHISVDFTESCRSNKDKESSSCENQNNSNTNSGTSSKFWKTAGIAAGSVIGGLGLVAAAPLALTAVGFTSTGIAASSWAAIMMAAAAVANGGGVAAGSLVAVLQSAGAVGIGATATGALGAAGAGIGGGAAFGFSKLFGKASCDDNSSNCNDSDSKSKKNDDDDGKNSKGKKNEDGKDPYEEATSLKKKNG